MRKDNLSKKQRHLIRELNDLVSKFGLDYSKIFLVKEELRTPVLELARNQIVRSQIIWKYVLIDELLNDVICWYFWGKRKTFAKLWKTKHFQNFNYFILERLFLQQKFDLGILKKFQVGYQMT